MTQPTWHQRVAARRAYRLRNHAAHILRSDYILSGRALCGALNPAVYIDAGKRHNPDNKCCRKCFTIAEKS